MRAVIDFKLKPPIKKAVWLELEEIADEFGAYSRPSDMEFSWWVSGGFFYFDRSTRGMIKVAFEGETDSFLRGTDVFSIKSGPAVTHTLAARNHPGLLVYLQTNRPDAIKMTVPGKIAFLDAEDPDQPLWWLPGMDALPIMRTLPGGVEEKTHHDGTVEHKHASHPWWHLADREHE